jgi:hypothetical protein
MHFNVCYAFYSQCSHQTVSIGIAAIFRAILLKEYIDTVVFLLFIHYGYKFIIFKVDVFHPEVFIRI